MATRADAKYVPPYQYQCARGHLIHADGPVAACPVHRCPGPLVRIGPGSGTTPGAKTRLAGRR